MSDNSRREFLADVGRGMLVAGLGSALVTDMGLASPAFAAEEAPKRLDFGPLEPLAALMQETPTAKLLPKLVEKISAGTELKTLIAAGSLANARAFGGEDYVGYHSLMALVPALELAKRMPKAEQALPVLKVLYRNTARIHERGGSEALHSFNSKYCGKEGKTGADLLEAMHKADRTEAENVFGVLVQGKPEQAYADLQPLVHDDADVHRVVLAWRSWALLDLTGREHTQTLLRQSVRYCVQSEKWRIERKYRVPGIRALLPKLFDTHKLASKKPGMKTPDDARINSLAEVIFGTKRDDAAEAVAVALAEGIAPEAIAQAISRAANQLVLRDPGRRDGTGPKPKGSVHGDSIGVHASDAANAWRNIARVSTGRNVFASLIVGAYHTAGQSGTFPKEPMPLAEHREKVKTKDPAALLRELDGAIKEKNQAHAVAVAFVYGEAGNPVKDAFDVLLRYAVSEDGALHAEKYYQTVMEEYAAARPSHRLAQLVALARVTASESGYPAPGVAEARRLLKV